MNSLRSSLLYWILFIGMTPCAYADGQDLSSQPGHDYARKAVAENAQKSADEVEEKYTQLIQAIRASTFPGDSEHNAQTADWLASEHQQWLDYRESHCWLQSFVYVYPAGSRMSDSEYNSCTLKMNNQRIKFLDGIGYEYHR